MALAACASWVVGGCLSPTLPLPPPGPPDEVTATETEGVYLVKGTVTPDSRAMIMNTATDRFWGQQTRSDGRYEIFVEGSPGDTMLVFYVLGAEESGSADFRLP